jgi:hypothetical protein
MDPIPLINVPIGAANLHQVFNWLITEINNQLANVDNVPPSAPEAFSLTVSVAPRTPAAPSGASAKEGHPTPRLLSHPTPRRSA